MIKKKDFVVKSNSRDEVFQVDEVSDCGTYFSIVDAQNLRRGVMLESQIYKINPLKVMVAKKWITSNLEEVE